MMSWRINRISKTEEEGRGPPSHVQEQARTQAKDMSFGKLTLPSLGVAAGREWVAGTSTVGEACIRQWEQGGEEDAPSESMRRCLRTRGDVEGSSMPRAIELFRFKNVTHAAL